MGGQVLAHSGWVVGLKEKPLKGTETTQEIHEGLRFTPQEVSSPATFWEFGALVRDVAHGKCGLGSGSGTQ